MKRNIIVAVSDRTYHDVRVWAARRDTSLSKSVQDFLATLPTLNTARSFPLAAGRSEMEDQINGKTERRTSYRPSCGDWREKSAVKL